MFRITFIHSLPHEKSKSQVTLIRFVINIGLIMFLKCGHNIEIFSLMGSARKQEWTMIMWKMIYIFENRNLWNNLKNNTYARIMLYVLNMMFKHRHKQHLISVNYANPRFRRIILLKKKTKMLLIAHQHIFQIDHIVIW